jgi:hypothetical protein
MLERPDVEKVVRELDKTRSTTLAHLLGFMHTFNLRFGRATTPEQRAAYESLYPPMAAFCDKALKSLDQKPATAYKKAETPTQPGEFFRGMKPNELEGVPPPPRPEAAGTPK